MENIKELPKFVGFPKIGRLSRNMIITEKLDGTNGQICITPEGEFLVGSRTRWITPEEDNHGFARWAYDNREELLKLGVGYHFGEWWGNGINRGYGLPQGDKRFSLFNVKRWKDNPDLPSCCRVVPLLYEGPFCLNRIDFIMWALEANGSLAAKGYRDPEGIIILHTAKNVLFKKTIKDDEKPKNLK